MSSEWDEAAIPVEEAQKKFNLETLKNVWCFKNGIKESCHSVLSRSEPENKYHVVTMGGRYDNSNYVLVWFESRTGICRDDPFGGSVRCSVCKNHINHLVRENKGEVVPQASCFYQGDVSSSTGLGL